MCLFQLLEQLSQNSQALINLEALISRELFLEDHFPFLVQNPCKLICFFVLFYFYFLLVVLSIFNSDLFISILNQGAIHSESNNTY